MVGAKSTQTRVVGILTDEMHPYTLLFNYFYTCIHVQLFSDLHVRFTSIATVINHHLEQKYRNKLLQ